jgi:CopA family copper-resistance protein
MNYIKSGHAFMIEKLKIPKFGIPVILILFSAIAGQARAETVIYELTIAQEEITIDSKSAEGMTINGSIPGPTLRFKEGDVARIHVHNNMTVSTSIHWHGLLVPPNMDGVPYLSFPPIQPGTTFTYEFPIRQSGTYWYHSHSSLQEQRGVYGSIVIMPLDEATDINDDHVILLSDWTVENPHSVLRSLKRGSEWYAMAKGSGQSIIGAARADLLGDYIARELQRMPPMDIADVAYDYFLANGQPETSIDIAGGKTVRLRIINGSATTYFHLEYAGGPMSIISADGQDVQPLTQQRILIGVAETYDVLIETPKSGAYELRATAHDGSGYTTIWLGSGTRSAAPNIPKPNLYENRAHGHPASIWALTPSGVMGMPDKMVESGMFDRPGMMNMHDEQMVQHLDRNGKKFATNFGILASDVSSNHDLASEGMDPRRPWPPYANLRATQSTAFKPEKPIREIRLTLDGDMERYVWFLNNKALSESDVIRIHEGEAVRFIMINRTMMHHPMHLHGHFFRVLNGQGDYAPLKHTVDVAPMSTTVIEFYGNEVGDWFFHCHLLYHMKSGMARVIHYEEYQTDPEVASIQPNLFKESWYAWGEADVVSNMTEGALTLSNTRNIFQGSWEAGWQNVDETDWEGLLSYDRYFNRFSSIMVGANFLGSGDDTEDSRAVAGFRYLLPLHLESLFWVDSDGGARVSLEKEFTLTPRLSLIGEVQYDTHDLWEGKTGLSYTVTKSFSLLGQWHSEFGWGAGLQIRF